MAPGKPGFEPGDLEEEDGLRRGIFPALLRRQEASRMERQIEIDRSMIEMLATDLKSYHQLSLLITEYKAFDYRNL